MADPEPFWLDTNTISRVANGDVMLEIELMSLRNSGFQFMYVPSVNRELFLGNPYRGKPAPPELFMRKQMAIARLRAQLDDTVDRARALELLERGFNLPRHMESDVEILSQVAASAEIRGIDEPKIFSCDIDVFKHAERWGIEPWTRSTPIPESARIYAWQPEAPKINQPYATPIFNASNATEFMSGIAALNAMQVQALSRISMQDAGAEAWEEWRDDRQRLRESLRKYPGRGYSVTFWFDHVVASDINFADEWTYLTMATEISSKPITVPLRIVVGPRSGHARFENIDVWIPPMYPPVSPKPKPIAQGGATGPGINYSPQMDAVEVEVYSDLDPNTPKSMWQIAHDTGLPDGDVGIALNKLRMKNMAAYWNKGEASGWIRTQ
jgi:hypothetical protein